MEVMNPRCWGLDVHQKSVVACGITPETREVRTFSTMTSDLLKLKDWRGEGGVPPVAMASTGVLWKPGYNRLEGDFTVLVVNAHHLRAVPGRKTAVKDAEWIADWLRHGLVRGTPDRAQRELRELTRYRRSLLQQRSAAVNRIPKRCPELVEGVLAGATIKLSSGATDVVGVSGRAILEAMVRGTEDPKVRAALARGRLRHQTAALEEALYGLVGPHQRRLLDSQLRQLAFLDQELARLDAEAAQRRRPLEEVLARRDGSHGRGRRSSEAELAESGVDRGRFPSASHLASWARLGPGNNESAGQRSSGRTGHGNPWLRRSWGRRISLQSTASP